MITHPPLDFRLQGEFAGFIRTTAGKKRLRLRTADGEMLLKVERELRRELAGRLERGTTVEVAGVVRTELFTGETKRVVTQVNAVVAGRAEIERGGPVCTIRVCAKKNCWKQGGREVFRHLERELTARGWTENVRLKAVGCFDQCDHAPVLECGAHLHRHCSPAKATALLASLEKKTPPPD
jgi:hypothetical protein